MFVTSEGLEKKGWLLGIQATIDKAVGKDGPGWKVVGVSWVSVGQMTGDALGVDCFSVMLLHQNVLILW